MRRQENHISGLSFLVEFSIEDECHDLKPKFGVE